MLKQEGFILSDDGWTLALPERLLFGFDEYAIQNSQTRTPQPIGTTAA